MFFLLFGSFLLFSPFLIPLCLIVWLGNLIFFYCARLLLGVALTLRVPLFGLIFACRYLLVATGASIELISFTMEFKEAIQEL